jgi:hypothetical protein
VLLPFLNTGTRAACFHKDGIVSLVTLKLKVREEMKIRELPLSIKS